MYSSSTANRGKFYFHHFVKYYLTLIVRYGVDERHTFNTHTRRHTFNTHKKLHGTKTQTHKDTFFLKNDLNI